MSKMELGLKTTKAKKNFIDSSGSIEAADISEEKIKMEDKNEKGKKVQAPLVKPEKNAIVGLLFLIIAICAGSASAVAA
jgi:hypothetical protein